MKQNETPVLLLTGYLGSGKTTLVNKILSNNKGIKFAVIVKRYWRSEYRCRPHRKRRCGRPARRFVGGIAEWLHLLHAKNGFGETA